MKYFDVSFTVGAIDYMKIMVENYSEINSGRYGIYISYIVDENLPVVGIMDTSIMGEIDYDIKYEGIQIFIDRKQSFFSAMKGCYIDVKDRKLLRISFPSKDIVVTFKVCVQ